MKSIRGAGFTCDILPNSISVLHPTIALLTVKFVRNFPESQTVMQVNFIRYFISFNQSEWTEIGTTDENFFYFHFDSMWFYFNTITLSLIHVSPTSAWEFRILWCPFVAWAKQCALGSVQSVSLMYGSTAKLLLFSFAECRGRTNTEREKIAIENNVKNLSLWWAFKNKIEILIHYVCLHLI